MLQVFGYGRLASDPEMKYLPDGTPLANFRVAFRKSVKPKEGEPDANFVNCTAYRHSAEFAGNYLAKGSEVVIAGRLEQRQWTRDDGSKGSVMEIQIDRLQGCGKKGGEEEG